MDRRTPLKHITINSELNTQEGEENVVTLHHPFLSPIRTVITDERQLQKQFKKKLDKKSSNVLTFLNIK